MDHLNRIIEFVSEAALHKNIDFLLIGAYARDIFLKGTSIIATPRMTYDIDVACQVKNWKEYNSLIKILIEDYGFRPAKGHKQRLLSEDDIPLDIVPFGEIENQNGEIAWPPDFDENMSVIGFQVAYASGNKIYIGTTKIKIIKPELFALLKIVSFIQTPSRTKDLKDFYFIADNYFEIIDADAKIYAPNGIDADILLPEDYDFTVAGAELIGRDCSRIDDQLSNQIMAMINDYNTEDQLSIDLVSTCNIKGDLSQRIISGLSDGISLIKY
jgi:predicted nucleotidyltransferase